MLFCKRLARECRESPSKPGLGNCSFFHILPFLYLILGSPPVLTLLWILQALSGEASTAAKSNLQWYFSH